ncbi:hypothetical protein SEPCBS57363_006784 [Sporothrix epigloea]|uniref:HMG box domain-containing protein n=1 Tax=Sporothrix epigloea TaxID=1892477 RepID=A0ABP0E6R4_9PEZI
MSFSTTRRVTFVVNDDNKKLSIIIPEEIITAEQIRNVARNFQHITDEDCSIIYNSEERTFRLTQMVDSQSLNDPRLTIVGHAKAVESSKASSPSARSSRILRPPNAWIIYRSRKSKEIRKQLPHATAGYISTVVSRMWKLETRETRLLYNTMALDAQKLHKQMYPDYKYNANSKKTKQT